jgi:6-phosphogluconolactonase
MVKPTVQVEADEDAVGRALCAIIERESAAAIAARGAFAFGISGGSMLKMLSNLAGESSVDWARSTMAFVSHRCVPLDSDGATYHKARPKFLDAWAARGLSVLLPSGSADSEREAAAYEAALAAAVPRDPRSGLPAFDLLLIGVGLDGPARAAAPAPAPAQASSCSAGSPWPCAPHARAPLAPRR